MSLVEPRFLRACRCKAVDRTPVWFMRQAGRYLPEYRALRNRYSLLDLCRTPDLAAAVTLQPIRRLEVDAAILFSDLLLPLVPMGLTVEFSGDEQPHVSTPVRTGGDVAALRVYTPEEEIPDVFEAVRLARQDLSRGVPLIGCAGAPFTMACYAVEGGRSAAFGVTKSLMFGAPDAWHALADKLATVIARVLRAQVTAGAQALQLFDSWAGTLSAEDYRRFVLPHTRTLLDQLADLDVPVIHFGTGTRDLVELRRDAGGDVIGADWRVPLDEAWSRIGYDRAIQGNLDPTLLIGPMERMLEGAADVLGRAGGRPGHIFNLGHGILPSTPVERVQALARYVHSHSAA